MAFDQEVGTTNVRSTLFDGKVKGFADRAYKFKQAVTISSTGAWKNYFFREQNSVLTVQSGNSQKGISRGADFPQAVVTWERVLATIEKHGLEDFIYWEDIISNEVDVQERTLFKIAERVAKSVDDAIWDGLTENRVAVNISSYAIPAGYSWDVASGAAIIDNLLYAKQLIAEYNYDTSDLMCFVSPKGYRDIMNYIASKGAQFPEFGTEVAKNGQSGKLCGIQLVVSNSVTASYALVVKPKICGTWKELVSLSTNVEEDKFKGVKIRAVEMGTLQLTDPRAVVLISNTDAP